MAPQRTVLIVEDEPLVALTLSEMAEEMGYDVLGPVASEQLAIAEARRLTPDTILMDIRLAEGGNGLQAAIEIRKRADTPIVFCTAFADEPDLRQQIAALDRTRLVAKPVMRSLLRQALAEVAGR
jgi:two-component system, response regulator PdtaR